MAETTSSADAILEESEGVVISVASNNVNYPPKELVCDLDMLYDESKWESLLAHFRDPGSICTDVETDLLFKIKTEPHEKLVAYYLALIVLLGEYSNRGVYLTTLMIKNNPSNYTAWHHRTECVNRRTLTIKEELDFARQCTFASPKAYQPWNYRRTLCAYANSCFDELEYIQFEILASPKNHCAWSLLTWLVEHYLHDSEQLMEQLKFCDFLLDADVYNNTAWVYRRFLLEHHRDKIDDKRLEEMGRRDVQRFVHAPNNHSAAEYLNDALPFYFGASQSRQCIKLDSCKELPQPCNGPWRKCVMDALAPASEVAALQLVYNLEFQEEEDDDHKNNRNASLLQRLQELKVADPIRSPYYSQLISNISRRGT